MSDFKPTPETNMTATQLLDRYQLHDQTILKAWASLHGIDGYDGFFTPPEVDLIDHAHHHIQNLGMTIDEYKNLLNRRINRTQIDCEPPQPIIHQNRTGDQQITTDASQAIEMLMDQYSEAIEVMGERIAENFIDELDLSVMRHLARKVQERQLLNNPPKPNRFLRTIQSVLQVRNSPLLASPSPEETQAQMESNHRLG